MIPNTAPLSERALNQASLWLQTLMQLLQKIWEWLSNETSLRYSNGLLAFEAELQWRKQSAQTAAPPTPPEIKPTAAFLIALDSAKVLALPHGMSQAGTIATIQLHNGMALLMENAQNPRNLFSNEIFKLENKHYTLKIIGPEKVAHEN